MLNMPLKFVYVDFWATVSKTVRPMQSDHCPDCLHVCLVCLSVTFMYCGQTVGYIKMKLGMEVGLGSSHIALYGNLAAPPPKKRGHSPQFWPMSVVAKVLDGSICHLVRR